MQHVGVAADERELEELRRLGEEIIKKIQAEREAESPRQRELFEERPSSKRGMAAWLSKRCAFEVSPDRIYRLLDVLALREDAIKRLVRSVSEGLFRETLTVVLFDVTTLYFESFEEDALRQKGFSKDNKAKETQVVLALATTSEGDPLWYELFPGKTWEGETFRSFLQSWRRENYPGSSGVVAADRRIFLGAKLEELREKGLHFVIGARLKSMKEKRKEEILDLSSYSILPPSGKDAEKILSKYRILEEEDGKRLLLTPKSGKGAYPRDVAVILEGLAGLCPQPCCMPLKYMPRSRKAS